MEYRLAVVNVLPVPGKGNEGRLSYQIKLGDDLMTDVYDNNLQDQVGNVAVIIKNSKGDDIYFFAKTKKINTSKKHMQEILSVFTGTIDSFKKKTLQSLVKYSNDIDGKKLPQPDINDRVKLSHGFSRVTEIKDGDIVHVPEEGYAQFQENREVAKERRAKEAQEKLNAINEYYESHKPFYKVKGKKLIKLDENLNETSETMDIPNTTMYLHYGYNYIQMNKLYDRPMQIDRNDATEKDIDKLETNLLPKVLTLPTKLFFKSPFDESLAKPATVTSQTNVSSATSNKPAQKSNTSNQSDINEDVLAEAPKASQVKAVADLVAGQTRRRKNSLGSVVVPPTTDVKMEQEKLKCKKK
jgi:hypothetical protein